MPSAIGLRVYRIGVNERGVSTPLPLNSAALAEKVPNFISRFIKAHTNAIKNSGLERSLSFDIKCEGEPGNSYGYIRYGTYGYESDLVDADTNEKNYRRKSTDVEEIPLYYEFWCPKGSSFGLAAFQSFGGRSCINLLVSQMRHNFEKANPQHILTFKKLQPNDAEGSAFASAEVRQLRLIKKNAPSDVASQYFDNGNKKPIDLEIVISARRKGSLGPLSKVFSSIKSGDRSVLEYAGVDFPDAVADIRIGGKTRKVGVLGANADAGVIDLTDALQFGPDGHPTLESLKEEVDSLLKDFCETLFGEKS